MLQVHVGTVVRERYEIQRLIGEGGFGTVWEARDLTSSDRVALKVLKTFNVSALRRFDVECAALARLHHPHCVRVIDSGRWEEGEPFLVTEFIEGQTLREWALSIPPMTERVAVAQQVAAALVHAHRAGVLHRDLKPENILVTTTEAGPVAKVLDFGLAKLTGLELRDVTKTGEVFGTPGYMSPEQLRGVARLSPATDVYSLGVVIFELFQGRAPFAGDTNLQTAMQHLVETAPRLAGAAPPEVVELVGKMLSKEPDARPTMHVVVQRLSGQRTAVEQRESPTRERDLRRFVPFVAMLVGLIVLAAIFIPEPEEPQARRTRAFEALHTAPATTNLPAALAATDGGNALQPDLKAMPGCGGSPLREGIHEGAGGHPIHLRLPTGYDPSVPAPMLVVFHDALQPVVELIDLDPLVRPALDRGFVVVAVTDDIREDTWLDEPDYVEAIESIEWVRERLCIDRDRTVFFGHGNGGWGATTVACTIGVRAIATTAHRLWKDRGYRCVGDRPVPMLTVSMMQDPFSPAAGGPGCIVNTVNRSVEEHEKRHRTAHGCDGRVANTYEDDGGTCWTAQCDVPLEWCRVQGARSWPGMSVRQVALQLGQVLCGGDERPANFDFGARVWQFFDAHTGTDR